MRDRGVKSRSRLSSPRSEVSFGGSRRDMTVAVQMAVGDSERKPQVDDPGPRRGPSSQPRQQPAGGRDVAQLHHRRKPPKAAASRNRAVPLRAAPAVACRAVVELPDHGLCGRAMGSQTVQVAQQTHHVVETLLDAEQGSVERVGIFRKAVA